MTGVQTCALPISIALHVLNNLSVELTGMLAERYDIVWTLDTAFLVFCALESVVILWKKRKSISAFFKEEKSDVPVVKWFFTTPLMLVVVVYFLIFTIASVTPF